MEKKDKEVVEQEIDLGSEQSRREFVTKLASAAGAIAAAGLVSGAVSQEAEAAERVAAPAKTVKVAPVTRTAGVAALKTEKLQNGFAMSVAGGDIGKALAREGLLPQGASADKVAVKLELST